MPAPLSGARLVLPGPRLDGASLYELMRDEGVTMALGVPTVWMMLQQHVEKSRVCNRATNCAWTVWSSVALLHRVRLSNAFEASVSMPVSCTPGA